MNQCRYCKQFLLQENASSGMVKCKGCGCLDGFSGSNNAGVIQIPKLSMEMSENFKSRDFSKLQLVKLNDINYHISKISSSSKLSLAQNKQLVDTILNIFENINLCTSLKNRSPVRDFNIQLCACLIFAIKVINDTRLFLSTKNIIEYFKQFYIVKKYRDKFQLSVYVFLSQIQLHRLYVFGEVSNTFSFSSEYRVLLHRFCYQQTPVIPLKLVCVIYDFFNVIMENVWLDGKGPNMGLATAIYHILYENCLLITDEVLEDVEVAEYLKADNTDVHNNIVQFFLVDIKRINNTSNDSRKRALKKCTQTLTKYHTCNINTLNTKQKKKRKR